MSRVRSCWAPTDGRPLLKSQLHVAWVLNHDHPLQLGDRFTLTHPPVAYPRTLLPPIHHTDSLPYTIHVRIHLRTMRSVSPAPRPRMMASVMPSS